MIDQCSKQKPEVLDALLQVETNKSHEKELEIRESIHDYQALQMN